MEKASTSTAALCAWMGRSGVLMSGWLSLLPAMPPAPSPDPVSLICAAAAKVHLDISWVGKAPQAAGAWGYCIMGDGANTHWREKGLTHRKSATPYCVAREGPGERLCSAATAMQCNPRQATLLASPRLSTAQMNSWLGLPVQCWLLNRT